MKKKKIFKTLAFSSLAAVMAAGGIFAFAPIGASASTPPPTTTTGLGLDPKNDPVVYTTESGLEIKMSNANKFSGAVTTTTNTGYTYTQDLTSFYYFTMGTYSGTIYTGKNTSETYTVTNEPVNWIILGVGSHSNAFVESVSNYLFSTIKNNDYLFSNGEYYFDNQHETFSPAGQLIDSTISAKTYIMGKVKDSITVHTDIPKGCMLVLSEKLLGSMYFSTDYIGDKWLYNSNGIETKAIQIGVSTGNRYRYLGNVATHETGAQSWTTSGNAGGILYNYINGLFSKDTSGNVINNALGLTTAQASQVVPQQLYTYYSNGSGYDYAETPSTDGGTYYTMFPLANRAVHSSTKQNFCVDDYLKTSNCRIASLIGSNQNFLWWLRSGRLEYSYCSDFIWHSGEYSGSTASGLTCTQTLQGVRPAMVMKLA